MKESDTDQDPYRWVMLALLTGLYICFGIISRSIAPLVTPVIRDLNLTYSQMGLILGSWQLTYIGAAVMAGTIIDRWGVRKSLMAGMVVIGLSGVLRFFVSGFAEMLGAVSLFGAGGCMISIGAPKAVSLWFRGRSRGTALGISLTGSWTGGILCLGLTNSLVMPLTGESWRATFLIYGLLTLMIASIWWFFSRDRGMPKSGTSEGIISVFSRLIILRNVQYLFILGLMTFTLIHGFSQWLPKLLEMKGYTPALASSLASVPLLAGIPSLLLIPSLVSPRCRKYYVSGCSLISIAALILVVNSPGFLQLVGLILYGFITTSFVPILLVILMEIPELEPRHIGSATGAYYCISEIGGFTAPLIMGFLVDATGNFQSSVAFLAASAVVIMILSLLLKTRASGKKSGRGTI
jgi:cyanate permease